MEHTHRRKYTLNERFFEKWSPTMAYVLGYWFADGYMRKERSYRILISGNDKEHLAKLLRAFTADCPIVRHSEQCNCYGFTLCSKRLYEGLETRGGMRGKSRTLRFPSIPRQFMRDFIRGYFDGDGSVFFVQYVRTKDKKRTRELRTNFTSGSKEFLTDLMNVLYKEIGITKKKLGEYNDGSSIKLGYGMKDSDMLLQYMYYEGFPIGMDRKASFVAKIPSYQQHHIRSPG
jgi:hypothetical protein